jgi:type I restriction enzyme, R subunit
VSKETVPFAVRRFGGRCNQQAFIDFVLAQNVQMVVGELASDKLTKLLQLKYHGTIADAVADLGRPNEITKVFAGFQQYPYPPQVAA